MWGKFARLFVIKSRWEAMAVIYALAVGAVERGLHYLDQYPGVGGWLLFAACTGAVFMAGARLMEITRPDAGQRRRLSDLDPAETGQA
jgi:hypothetical protein